MRLIPSKTNNNFLIYCAITLVGTFIIYRSLFAGWDLSSSSRLSLTSYPFWLFAIAAVIIAPLSEEFMFRGNFFKSKYLKWISLAVLIIFAATSLFSNPMITIAVLSYAICYAIGTVLIPENTYYQKFLYIFSCISFGLFHYKFSDFGTLDSSSLLMIQTGAGFILCWVFLNYGYLKSVLIHAAYNGFFMFISFIGLMIPDDQVQKYEVDFVNIEYRENGLNTRKSDISIYEDSIVCNNCRLYSLAQYYNSNKDDKKASYDFKSENSFMKYNLKAISDSVNFLEDKNAFDFLLEIDLIKLDTLE